LDISRADPYARDVEKLRNQPDALKTTGEVIK